MESTIQKIRQLTIPYGAASCVKLQKNDQVSALGRRFVLGNGVDGFSNTEFKLNPRDGKYYFIECNARVWMQIKLTEHIKLSYIKAYIDFLSSKSYRYYETHYDKQVYWVDFPYDLISCLNGFMLSPKRALQQIRSYLHARSFGLLSLHDLNPLISKLCKK
jgi:predicted ATP-grasp superfamily ATP-dependent carboligase